MSCVPLISLIPEMEVVKKAGIGQMAVAVIDCEEGGEDGRGILNFCFSFLFFKKYFLLVFWNLKN